ncbi:hypothetical protein [Clostridium sp. 'White wine YQ']|uniref:hypothetical protein n=1 Tax=Clostridium sp. 'White wine YQ' TaxID=3027474 RepID=UPI00236570D0|nr:hypothetical protein [Clostridium sp. 'White wine YQ']MDD7794267.1 hypothetical protein [Clostridium sp. 'White wine YQ']
MKKFIISLMFLLLLTSNIANASPAARATSNTFKEGVYKLSDFIYSPTNMYNLKNVSSSNTVYLLIFDESQAIVQSIRLEPNSPYYNTISLRPDDRLAILGNGEVYIAPKTS